MQVINTIFSIAIIIMSVVVHEVSHGFMAERFGDKTARNAGRLTLNPLRHLDFFGSVVLPIFLYFSTGLAFGWAKPVPYNPDNLTNRRWGTMWVAAAGVLANFLIAIIFSLLIRFSPGVVLSAEFYFITSSIVLVNLALAVFNLVPIPPLDGSKILFTFLPNSAYRFMIFMERFSFILLVIFVFFFSQHLYPVLSYLYTLFTGLGIPLQ